jgi:hypothetical protein
LVILGYDSHPGLVKVDEVVEPGQGLANRDLIDEDVDIELLTPRHRDTLVDGAEGCGRVARGVSVEANGCARRTLNDVSAAAWAQ